MSALELADWELELSDSSADSNAGPPKIGPCIPVSIVQYCVFPIKVPMLTCPKRHANRYDFEIVNTITNNGENVSN